MHRLTPYFSKLSEEAPPGIPTYPEYGPLEISDYKKFLAEAKTPFFERWNHLKNQKKRSIKLVDSQCSFGDFNIVKLIGGGTFGKVYLVVHNPTGEHHAMKCVHKQKIVDLQQVDNSRTEKLVMQCSNCPFILRLEYFFKDNSYLYYILPFIKGGELFQYLHQVGKMSESTAMFYIAQVILALEYLHYLDIIYRDLKPENVLIDHTGYIKLTDFGFCKHLISGRTFTVCGTPDYLAPETLRNEGYGKAVDWWAVGAMTYELTVGFPPFKERNDSKRYYRILAGSYRFPPFMSDDLKDLITNTLQVDVTKRLGNLKNGVNGFKTHKWFKTLNWLSIVCRKASPPYVPLTDSDSDTRHFKKHSHISLHVAEFLEYSKEFADF